VARAILRANDIYNVDIESVSGEFSDHYDPRSNVIRLSNKVYSSTSIAAAGVAAHEAGHAIQYAKGYAPIKLRQAIIPITQIGSKISFPLVIVGLIFNFSILVTVGIILFATVTFFQLVTLPVEVNASRRAIKALDQNRILTGDELYGAKKVLGAAALTYVAALAVSLMSLIRLLLINRRR